MADGGADGMGASENSPVPAIEAAGLIKSFGEVEAVAGVGFEVRPGEIFGFLGPNGAGKTTTINMLAGLARPDSGTITIHGLDRKKNFQAVQHMIGVVPDESNLYPELTGFENLCFCAALYGLDKKSRQARAGELLKLFGLEQAAGRKFGGYSKGMKRKLTIAAGIIHRPRILFLDEPTTGIDVASARQIRELIRGLNRSGCTVFLTTHYLEEAERLCDRISFMVKGRIVKTDAVSSLLRDYAGRRAIQFSLSAVTADLVFKIGESFPDYTCDQLSASSLRVSSGDKIDLIPLIQFFKDNQIEVMEARRAGPSLEDVFVRVTGLETGDLTAQSKGPGKGK